MSSPANQPVEADHFATDRLQELLTDEMRQTVMRHLLAEGEASIEELTTVTSEALAAGPVTDHDRVRTAICLQIDHLPVLVEHDLITVDGTTVALAFLPNQTIRTLQHVLEH